MFSFLWSAHLLQRYCTLQQQLQGRILTEPEWAHYLSYSKMLDYYSSFLAQSNKSLQLPAYKGRRGNETIICVAVIHTIIASHVEDANMKCSYNSWVAVFLCHPLNIFMICPWDGKLSFSRSPHPLRLAVSSGEADQRGHFCLRGNGRGDRTDTTVASCWEKRGGKAEGEGGASR